MNIQSQTPNDNFKTDSEKDMYIDFSSLFLLASLNETSLAKLSTILIEKSAIQQFNRKTVKKFRNSNLLVEVENRKTH